MDKTIKMSSEELIRRKNLRENHKKKYKYMIAIIICIVLIIFILFSIYQQLSQYSKGNASNTAIKNEAVRMDVVEDFWDTEIEFDYLYSINTDIVGWLLFRRI